MLAWLRGAFSRVVTWFRPGANRHGSAPIGTPPLAAPAQEAPSREVVTVETPETPQEAPTAPQPAPHAARPADPSQAPPASRAPIQAPPEAPEQAPEQAHDAEAPQNRRARRKLSALERARRKHDKFVTPQGAPPVPRHVERQPADPDPEPAPAITPPLIHDAEDWIADKHHEGGDELVLYKETEFWGEYNFRDSILEQLERYFVYLRRMRKEAPDAYALYKTLGATLVPYVTVTGDLACKEEKHAPRKPLKKIPALSAWFKTHRPSFGCFAYGANPLAEKAELEGDKDAKGEKLWLMIPKFMYFIKYKHPPPTVQPMTGGDIYCMTIWWDRPHDPKAVHRKHGVPQEYPVFVSHDGETVRILKTLDTRWESVLRRTRKHDAAGNVKMYTHIPSRGWHVAKDFQEWANEKHERVEYLLGKIFVESVKVYEYANYSMVRVAATKNDMTAVFGVNMQRMGYFFQDRDYVLNANGARKAVFHMVRAHERHTAKGTHAVKFHFRGEKEFTWAGYQVSITIPGRDHFMLPEYDVGAVDGIPKGQERKYLTMAELAKRLARDIEVGLGGKK